MEDPQSRPDPPPGPTCQEVGDQAAAYAWGALDPETRAAVDEHRAACGSCDARLLAAERTISQLDQALPHLPPPPDLRARVLAATAASARPSPPTAAPAPLAPPRSVSPVQPTRAPAAHTGPAAVRSAPGVAARTARSSRHLPPFAAGVATGLVGAVCAVAAAWLLVLRPDLAGLLAPAQSGLADTERELHLPIAIPAPPPPSARRLIELAAPSGAARGVLMYDQATGSGILLVHEPDSPAGTQYEVSLIRGTQRVVVGAFMVDEHGIGTGMLPDPPALKNPQRIEVQPKQSGAGAALSADF